MPEEIQITLTLISLQGIWKYSTDLIILWACSSVVSGKDLRHLNVPFPLRKGRHLVGKEKQEAVAAR